MKKPVKIPTEPEDVDAFVETVLRNQANVEDLKSSLRRQLAPRRVRKPESQDLSSDIEELWDNVPV